jgi:Xaa-Pro aminopeptidase
VSYITPDKLIAEDNWSDLTQFRDPPQIDMERMHAYRMGRIKQQMIKRDVEVLIMVSPLSMRYAINFRSYSIFTMHVPSTYLFMSLDAPFLVHNGLDPVLEKRNIGLGQPMSHFYGGTDLTQYAERFAKDVEAYLVESGASNKRVALEYVNPSIVFALDKLGIEVIDGVLIVEEARIIKNVDEINCIKWSIAVAEHGAMMMKQALKPGVTEQQLWGIINYTNLANDGDWHEGRMLASGPRINPWLQEASERKVQSGDLVGFDTDMVGPYGYCADLSRTFHCGPAKPTARQKELYRLCADEVEFNLGLIKAGVSFSSIQQNAYPIPVEFREQSYPCVIHGVGMCDEYPHLNQSFRAPIEFDNHLEAGMVICVESYMGAVGEDDGVKLEEQILVTQDGYEQLTTMPLEDDLLS